MLSTSVLFANCGKLVDELGLGIREGLTGKVKGKVKVKLKTKILTLRKIQDMNFSKGMILEKVTDPETREIIHHNEAPLSDHYGYGSAKFKKTKKTIKMPNNLLRR